MHHPSMLPSQILATGWHLIHMVNMAVPIIAFNVTMMNQSATRIHRSDDSRSRVRANDVLLHDADKTEKKPAKTATKGILGRFSGRIS